MDPGTGVRPRRIGNKPPREAVLQVGPFDDHGTSRAELDGRLLEVEHGIPGEIVEGHVYGKRRRWARVVNILQSAPDRVSAPCPHFHQGCGGCPWQMLDYRSQVERKIRQVETEIDRGGLSIPVTQMHTMTEPWRYRTTAGISLGKHAGFRRHGTQSIVGLDDCPISHPLIGKLASHLNQAIQAGETPNFLGKMAVEVRVAGDPDEPLLHICIVPSPGSPHASVDAVMPLARSLARLSHLSGILYRYRQDQPQLIYGDPFATTLVMGKPFALSSATFFQTNTTLLPEIVDSLLQASNAGSESKVIDMYGGVGIFGLLLAPTVKEVVEIEVDPVAIEACKLSCSLQGLSNVRFLRATAETVMEGIGAADTVIVDPPRSGLTPRVIEVLGRIRPSRILYISCLARSLVRDIVSLSEYGYQSQGIEAFDFYPQTYHVELFTTLHLRGP